MFSPTEMGKLQIRFDRKFVVFQKTSARSVDGRDEMGKKSKSNTPAAEPAAVAASSSSSDVFTVPSAEKVPTSHHVAAHWGAEQLRARHASWL